MIRQLITTLLAALAMNLFAANAFAAVDANQATRADLETVKGIGPGLSGKIVKARESGSFRNWGDLVERVGGIGAGNAAKLSQGGLTVSGAAYEGSAAAPAKAKSAEKAEKAEKADTASDKPKKAKKGDKAAEAA